VVSFYNSSEISQELTGTIIDLYINREFISKFPGQFIFIVHELFFFLCWLLPFNLQAILPNDKLFFNPLFIIVTWKI